MTDQKDFDRAAEIFFWNRWLLSKLGLWPAEKSDLRFFLSFGYFMYDIVLEYLDLFLFIDNLEHVISNLTENILITAIIVRMLMVRIYHFELGQVLSEAMTDLDIRKYKNEEEKQMVLAYNSTSKAFVKLLMTNVALTATSYYFQPILGQMGFLLGSSDNSTFVLQLPYQFYSFYKVDKLQSYMWTYISQFPFVFISGFAQAAADCLMVTMVYHVAGQMSILALRIKNLTPEPKKCTGEIKTLLKDHSRLLGMGKTIQEAFSVTLLANIISSIILICIVGCQILQIIASGETERLGTFVILIVLIFLILFAHCTIGQCLINESEKVCAAFYDCQWYCMSTNDAKIILLCIERSQKSLKLTAGKFRIYCLVTLTDILKTSLGYLSVLRRFL